MRTEAKRYKRVFITSGAIYTGKKNELAVNYDDHALIPHSFYKLAFYEKDDGTLKFSCWLMENNDSIQPYNKCLVTLIALENRTGKLFLNHNVLKRLDPASVAEHLS